MSDEMPTHGAATLTCAAGVTPERLSAWRDGLLPADQSAWLAAHAAGCPACSTRLRDYDQIGAALRGQVISRPVADPWPAMRLRLTRERRRELRLPSAPRWGGVGALLAAALLVALFAGLLAQQAARRPQPASTATATMATATPSAPLAVWTQVPSYSGLYGLAVAPSDPRVAYQLWSDASGAPLFRGTNDQGATWRQLTLPYIPNASYPAFGFWSGVSFNPFDARVVYLQIAASMKAPSTSCTSNGGGESNVTHPVCIYQYISMDSGAHWQPLSLPIIGNFTAPQVGQQGFTGQRDTGDATSPTHLYSAIAQRGQGTLRLVRSDDGGVTWRLIDGAIIAAGQYATSFAATATGSTIFALATPPSGSGTPTTPETIWTSDDAGATWTNLGPAPNTTILSMTAARVANSSKPILYLLTTDNRSNEYIEGSLYGVSGSFHIAPDPAPRCQPSGNSYLLGSLADGSVLAWCGGEIEAWLALPARADQGWRPVAANPGVNTIQSTFTQALPNGSTRLWLLTQDNTGAQAEYCTLPN